MFSCAKWIGREKGWTNHSAADYIAKNFCADKKKYKKFTLKISAQGLFKASINGKDLADTFFDPGESHYGKMAYFVTYDITNFLSDGKNALGVILGNGQYTNFIVNPTMEKDGVLIEPHRYQKHDGKVFAEGIYGIKKMIAVIEADGDKILWSDESWLVTEGAVVFQNWYGGEDYDATREVKGWNMPSCDRRKWDRVGVFEDICVAFTERFFNPVRVVEKIEPVKITKNGESYIVDFGKNGAGVVKIKLETTPAMRGNKIEILPCEELTEQGLADQRSSTQSWSETKNCTVSDSYVIKGSGEEEWNPIFCYHGFRYAEVKGLCCEIKKDTFTYLRLMADNSKQGFFETDNTMLSRINDMTERSIESNMFFTFTDCPQIEKLGWIETSHLMFRSMAYCRDIQSWVNKIALDIAASAFPDGYVPAIVPEFHRITGLSRDINWGGACIMTPWYCYEYYGDKNVLEYAVETGKNYINHLSEYIKDGLVQNYSQMGDWGQINESTPTILVENCAFYLLLKTYGKILTALGKKDAAAEYDAWAEKVKIAFHENNACHNKETGVYGNGSQASYGCVLFSGIVLKENELDAVNRLVEAVEKADFHLTGGEVGLKQVFSALSKYGYDSVVYKMVTNKSVPGYGYFVEKNLTTLPEYWNYEELWWGMVRSRNHAMMGHVKQWLVEGVLGIKYDGTNKVTIKPFVPENTTYAKGKVLCGCGELAVSWRVTGANKIKIEVTSPEEAEICILPPKGYECI